MTFPLLHNGPVNYFAGLAAVSEICLEQHDTYTKQTYRNRCLILGPNGVIPLSVPVRHGRGNKLLYRDIRIDYSESWNRIHWKSLVASYASSPYFEFVRDDLHPFYEKKFTFLFDLNLKILKTTLELLGLNRPVRLTGKFMPLTGPSDPRESIHPKKRPGHPGAPVDYYQVFSDRHGFQSNLSIIDLLCNMGPEARGVLIRTGNPASP